MATLRAGSDIARSLDTLLAAQAEVDAGWRNLYFEARLQGRLEQVVATAPHSLNKALAMTRRENEARGRRVRWADGL